MKTLFLYVSVGFCAGFINGLFGTGGAIPLLAIFTYLSLDTDKAFATANISVMLLSLVSFVLYLRNGTVTGDFLPTF